MECLTPGSGYQEVVFEKGAQVGGSECGNNLVGYCMDEYPSPMLHVMPTETAAKDNATKRIGPMIEACPALAEKLSSFRGNTTLSKDFPGGSWSSVGANAPAGLRSKPVRVAIIDEEDGCPPDVGGEGDVKELVGARLRTFGDSILLRISTPTLALVSRIHAAYQNSDQRIYEVPCPHCGHHQPLVWEQVRWNQDATEVWYECRHCQERIEETAKTGMLRGGRWVQRNPGHHVAGFHLNSLYSPYGWYSWLDAVRQWQLAQQSEAVMKTFVNTTLGQPYNPPSSSLDWETLARRERLYSAGQVDADVGMLTAGVDVQGDRLEVEVVGWGRNFRTWSIAYSVIAGSTADPATWDKLATVLGNRYATQDGRVLGIRKAAIDSGWNSQEVYRFSLDHKEQVACIKGRGELQAVVAAPTDMEVGEAGKKIKFASRLWAVGTNAVKMELFAWLANTEGQPGYATWPHEYRDEYFKQLTAEHMVLAIRNGYEQWVWEKTRERNEALDCRVYARAAFAIAGGDRLTDEQWRQLLDNGRLDDTGGRIKVKPRQPRGKV